MTRRCERIKNKCIERVTDQVEEGGGFGEHEGDAGDEVQAGHGLRQSLIVAGETAEACGCREWRHWVRRPAPRPGAAQRGGRAPWPRSSPPPASAGPGHRPHAR